MANLSGYNFAHSRSSDWGSALNRRFTVIPSPLVFVVRKTGGIHGSTAMVRYSFRIYVYSCLSKHGPI
ncbi:hypothetical protein F6P93_17395 [Escherichia coli]|nr:hypothetical protein F6P93_17395 [Escherichia coli]